MGMSSADVEWPNLPEDWQSRIAAMSCVSRFYIRGVPVGGTYDTNADPRFKLFVEAFPDVSHILELGSLEGAFTRLLSKRPATTRVVSVEGRESNAAKQRELLSWGGLTNVQLIVRDLEVVAIKPFAKFDVVFCVGVLYHVQKPLRLLQNIATASDNLFLWTHCADDSVSVEDGYSGDWYAEGGLTDPLSGLSARSFWPTFSELLRMLGDVGYSDVRILTHSESSPAAKSSVTLTARK
jgi:SAM-dependent methyltransferase